MTASSHDAGGVVVVVLDTGNNVLLHTHLLMTTSCVHVICGPVAQYGRLGLPFRFQSSYLSLSVVSSTVIFNSLGMGIALSSVFILNF